MNLGTVKVYATIRYFWECPNCGQDHEWFNIEEDKDGFITCYCCFQKFKAELKT